MKLVIIAAIAALGAASAATASEDVNQDAVEFCETAVRAELTEGQTRFSVDELNTEAGTTTVVLNVRYRERVTSQDRRSQVNRAKASTHGVRMPPTGPGLARPTSFAPGIKEVQQFTATCVVSAAEQSLTLE
ncbi:MAG: hypothetical protein AAF004_16015 [Pseudomonadota bacterium]